MSWRYWLAVVFFVSAALCVTRLHPGQGFLDFNQKPSNYPIIVAAEKDNGSLMLHFTADGKDRIFYIDSGADSSIYDPAKWPGADPKKPFRLEIFGKGQKLGTVFPDPSKGMPLFDFTSVRPDGSLGLDFLKQVVLMFDRKSGKAMLWPADSFDAQWVVDHLTEQDRRGPSAVTSNPWTVTSTRPDSDGRVVVDMSVDRRPLRGVLDTGCAFSGIGQKTLTQLRRWKYCEDKVTLWDRTAIESNYFVRNLKLPFTSSPIATMSGMQSESDADAWIGLEFIDRGQWVMDCSHRLFGFRAYRNDPSIAVQLPDGALTMRSDGSFGYIESVSANGERSVERINGLDPKTLLGDFSRMQTSSAFPEDLATKLSQLVTRSCRMTVNENGKPQTLLLPAYVRDDYPTIEQLEANEAPDSEASNPDPGAITITTDRQSSANNDGGAVIVTEPNGNESPQVLPPGTKFVAGDRSVTHAVDGSIILCPKGWKVTVSNTHEIRFVNTDGTVYEVVSD